MRNRVDVAPTNELESEQSFQLIWLDERSPDVRLQDEVYNKQITALKTYNIQSFEDVIECGNYLRQLPTCARSILVIDEESAGDLLPTAHRLTPVKCIFILRSSFVTTDCQQYLFPEYNKVN